MIVKKSSLIKNFLLLFLVIIGLYYAKIFLMPFSIGGVLASLFLPLCKRMEKMKVPKGIAVLLCIIILLVTLGGIFTLLGLHFSALITDFSEVKQKSIEILARIQEYIFNNLGVSAEKLSQIFNDEQPSFAKIVQVMAGSLVYIITNFILILVYFFCLLFYRGHIKNFILKLTAPSERNEMEQVIYSAAQVSQQYLVGLAKMIVCLWIMYGIGFSLIGVKNPLFFAVLCGLLEIVPFIGNLTGTLLTIVVAAVQGASFTMLGLIIITYGLVQFIQGWVLEPLLVGHQVKINPFITIIALVIGELIWGISGIFLAIPLTAMFKIVSDHIELLKPYGFLIGEIETKKKEPIIA